MAVRRGQIYWVEFSPVKGREQGGLRPAVIIQNDVGNRFAETTIVAAITRTVPAQPYAFQVVVAPNESGLPATSVVNCTQLTTIHQRGPESRLRPPKGETTIRPIGKLTEEKMREVEAALRFQLGL